MAFYFGPEDRRSLQTKSVGRYDHVPFLLTADLKYLDEMNQFLRERALGEWTPGAARKSPFARVRALSANTIVAYGRDLENFCTYMEIKEINWKTISYSELLEQYDRDMSTGAWSSTGENLKSSTINRRVDRAVEALQWAADRGHRGPFIVPTETVSRAIVRTRSAKAQSATTEVRVGRRRADPRQLRLPTREEINRWLAEIRVRRGSTRALACEAVIDIGWRLEEVALFQADQLPDPDTISLDRPARMDICYGTKGGRTLNDPEKRGKARTVRFARDFLIKLNNYKQLGRVKALKAFTDRHPGERMPKQLFLDEVTGRPLGRGSIYVAWHRTKTLPFPGFSPHTGRHTFACFTLLRLLTEEYQLIERTVDLIPRSAVLQNVESLIDVYIRPVLGHVSRETTERYLDWIADHLWVSHHRAAWSAFLDGPCG